jgi:hypothetical protein
VATNARWWQVIKSPRLGFIVGCGWLVVAASALGSILTSPSSHAWEVALAALTLLLGCVNIVSAVMLRRLRPANRRDRQGSHETP